MDIKLFHERSRKSRTKLEHYSQVEARKTKENFTSYCVMVRNLLETYSRDSIIASAWNYLFKFSRAERMYGK